MTGVEWLARRWPLSVDSTPDLERAVAYLDAPHDAKTALRAGYALATVTSVASLVVAVVPGVGAAGALLTSLVVGSGVAYATRRGPVALATAHRTRAVGDGAAVVGRMVLRMRIEPSPERAVQFAAETGDGPLARSLGEHARRAAGTHRTGLTGFADEWREWVPSLERATGLLAAAADAPPDRRERTLDRATAAVMEGTRDRMAAFAADVRGPITGLYAFGVLLPLALVGMVPAARTAGVHLTVGHVVLVYDVLLPVGLVWASGWLLLRRPVAFPPPQIPADHPDVPDRTLLAVLTGILAGVLAGGASRTLVAPWTLPIAAVGTGVGVAAVVRFQAAKAVRDEVRDAEAHLDDALHLVGRRVSEGEAVESALAAASADVPGATGDVLSEAVAVSRRANVGVGGGFLGDHGALRSLPSPRMRDAAVLLSLAAREGAPAGEAIVATGDQLTALRRVESEARRDLSRVTETLANTAAVFGPLVAGATVGLAAGTARVGGPMGGSLPVPPLGVAVGTYALLLAALLTALSTGLERGFDRSLVGYRVGVALLAATATYLASFAGTSLLVQF